MRLRPLLDLIRIPLAPTAIADSLAGYCVALSIAGVSPNLDAPPLLLVFGCSIALYCFGMAANDIFDRAKDARSGAGRPLVVGALSPGVATAVALGLLAGGLACAWALEILPVALFLVAAILLYDGGGKRIPLLGNVLMGSCRSLNFLVGVAAVLAAAGAGEEGAPGLVESLSRADYLVPAAILGGYIASVTAISLLEDRPYRRGPLKALVALQLCFPVGLALWAWNEPGAWMNAIVLAALLARELRLPPEQVTPDADASDAAPANAAPHPAEKAVRGGLRALYLVDAALLWKHGLAAPAFAVYGLFVFGWLCMRWWIESLRKAGGGA